MLKDVAVDNFIATSLSSRASCPTTMSDDGMLTSSFDHIFLLVACQRFRCPFIHGVIPFCEIIETIANY